jgi:dihydrolipoamide dehydrogenase
MNSQLGLEVVETMAFFGGVHVPTWRFGGCCPTIGAMAKEYEAIVIGGGPGGYVAAIRMGQLGVKTLCVEKEAMGGVCLNWGCIPSKALIAAANLANKVRNAEHMGITVKDLEVDVAKMQEWKEGIVNKLTSGVTSLVKGNGGDIALGTATLTSPTSVDVQTADGKTERYTATKGIIVATGTQMITIPGFEPDGEVVITAREAVSLQSAPKSMILIGGGVIGLELGMVYQKLGTKITVVELMDQLLPGTDPDLVRVVQKHLKAGGADVHLKSKAVKLDKSDGMAKVTIDTEGQEQLVEAEKVLVAVGFKPNSAGIGLDTVGVKLDDRGHIAVDEQMRTNVPTVFAIGDVAGMPYLAHKASKEGEIAAEVIAGHKAAADYRGMPAAIFTDPEIATVGMTETQAKAEGKKVKIGKFPFAASGRAMAVSETDGFIKVIIDEEDHQLLGVAIVGPEASDLISESALALEMCAFAEDVALTVHPHPTLGEGVMEAFKHALGEAVHVMNRR